MNITTSQAAKRLGVTNGTVIRLGNIGKLARVQKGTGKKRKVYRYVVGSINEFKKSDEYKVILNKSRGHINGWNKVKAVSGKNLKVMLPVPQESVATGIKTRLGNLEDEMTALKTEMSDLVEKVNHLIKIWS